jgi:hypothetical protein
MKRAAVPSIVVAVILLAVAVIAEAQQSKKIPRIGFLAPGSTASDSPRIDPFRRGLQELGYTEGQNIVIECDLRRESQNVFLPWWPSSFS